ncbi:hypothetical protein [Aquisphaera insulae]|uniref:hypothetical protein n=1 Tax=Aquisphaera insulae TaxID=2712864 RepID=UPI0013ECDFEA|nr:hypothetical protein [Aquisphaera insulae]
MGVSEKIVETLSRAIPVDYIRVEDDDGVSGFVISKKFRDMSMLDRQRLIADALDGSSSPLNARERRSVLMIAGLTPEEYEVVGTPIRIRDVREEPGGTIRMVLDGRHPDAESVGKLLSGHAGVETTEIEAVPEAFGDRMALRARGKSPSSLSRSEILRFLRKSPYVEIMRKS